MASAAQLQPRLPRRPLRRQLALAAGVLLVAMLAILVVWRILSPGRASQVATISSGAGLMWQVEVYARGGPPQRLRIRSGAFARPPTGHDYELWALPQGGGKPVSLGVLPYEQRTTRQRLTPLQQQALAKSAHLAVTLEPRGGAPGGEPQGTPVFLAPLLPVS